MIDDFMVRTMPVPECGCWLWMGGCDGHGYGGLDVDGKQQSAHRRAWSLFRGEIPKGMHVLHRCDVPCCVNPDHLFLGTPADNMADKSAKGRTARHFGEDNPASKLSADNVRAIRASSEKLKVLAARYSVGMSQISKVRRGERWRALDGAAA